MRVLIGLLVAGLVVSASLGQDAKTAGQPPAGKTQDKTAAKVTYRLGPDSQPQDGVPKGKLEGPTPFKSKVFDGTVRQYWVYVPAQYTPDKPAGVLVFQDGQRAVNPRGALRVPQVMENLIHKK